MKFKPVLYRGQLTSYLDFLTKARDRQGTEVAFWCNLGSLWWPADNWKKLISKQLLNEIGGTQYARQENIK